VEYKLHTTKKKIRARQTTVVYRALERVYG
jgi:hypothetical protein